MMNEDKEKEVQGRHGSIVRQWGVKFQLSKGEMIYAKKGQIHFTPLHLCAKNSGEFR